LTWLLLRPNFESGDGDRRCGWMPSLLAASSLLWNGAISKLIERTADGSRSGASSKSSYSAAADAVTSITRRKRVFFFNDPHLALIVSAAANILYKQNGIKGDGAATATLSVGAKMFFPQKKLSSKAEGETYFIID